MMDEIDQTRKPQLLTSRMAREFDNGLIYLFHRQHAFTDPAEIEIWNLPGLRRDFTNGLQSHIHAVRGQFQAQCSGAAFLADVSWPTQGGSVRPT